MKILAIAFALIVSLAFMGVAQAAKDKVAKLKGEVVSVAADGKVTIKTGKKDAIKNVVVETNDKTEVVIEGVAAKVSDLKAGQQVTVTPAEGVATKIEVAKPKAPKPAKPAN